MTQPIKYRRPEGGMFSMELPDDRQRRVQPREIEVEEMSPRYEKVHETWEQNEKVFNMVKGIKNDIFITTTREIKNKNGWGNSFDREVNAITNKTNTFYHEKFASEGTRPRKISREAATEEKENFSASDSYSFNELMFAFSESPKEVVINNAANRNYSGLAYTQ